MLTELQNVMENEIGLPPDRLILVGVSGGPDSLCLMNALWRLRYNLVVAHFDHGLRPEAGEEAHRVQQAAAQMGLPFYLGQDDTAAYANQEKLSLEEAARNLRYRFLFRLADQEGAAAVAVAHTADDQVETVLMHLLRGAGLAGLRGMQFRALPNPWSQAIPLVRPLLGAWREDVLAYIQKFNLQPNYDSSNQDLHFLRNRLRHELIPYLQGYNSAIRTHLWQMAEVLQDDYVIVQEVIDRTWQSGLLKEAPGAIAFNPTVLTEQSIGVQRGIIRRALGKLRPGLRNIDFQDVSQALEFVHHPPRSNQRDLAAGLRLLLEPNCLWIAAWEADLPGSGWPQMPKDALLTLNPGEKVFLLEDWELRAELLTTQAARFNSAPEIDAPDPNPFETWLDADYIRFPLSVRGRRPGDRFRPLGLDGHSLKVADFMINQRLPRRARQGWPLILSDNEIVWIPGLRMAHPVRIKASTNQVLHLSLQRASLDIGHSDK